MLMHVILISLAAFRALDFGVAFCLLTIPDLATEPSVEQLKSTEI
jgi:hypothetical protein